MEFSIVEILSGLQESIVAYLEGPNSILAKNPKNCEFILNSRIFLYKLPINHRWPTVGHRWPLVILRCILYESPCRSQC